MNTAAITEKRVILVGCSEKMQAALDLLFKRETRGGFTVVADAPDVCVFDYDWPQPDRLWSDYRARFPHLPTVIVSYLPVLPRSGAAAGDGEQRMLAKPIKPQLLISELQELTTKTTRRMPLSKAPLASSEESPPASSEQPAPAAGEPQRSARGSYTSNGSGTTASAIDERLADAEHLYERDVGINPLGEQFIAAIGAEFEPDRHFLGTLRAAVMQSRELGKALLIRHLLDGAEVLIRSEHGGEVLVDPPNADLRQICLRSFDPKSCSIQPLTAGDPRLQRGEWRPADELLWEVALRTSRGRLPVGSSTDQPLTMRRWPNFTRLMEAPHAMQIAAMMSHAPISMTTIIRQLRIDPGAVFSFFTAGEAIGLFAAGATVQPAVARTGPGEIKSATGTRGLLARLLRRLAAGRQ